MGTWDVEVGRVEVVARGEEGVFDSPVCVDALGAGAGPRRVLPWEEHER